MEQRTAFYIDTDSASSYNEENIPQRRTFGEGFEDFRYAFTGTDRKLLNIAKRLTRFESTGKVSGREVISLNLIDGSCTRYAEFDLK